MLGNINRRRLMLLIWIVVSIGITILTGAWRSVFDWPKAVSIARLDIAAERYAHSIGKTVDEIQTELRAKARKNYEEEIAAGLPDCDGMGFWSKEKCAFWQPNTTFALAPPVEDMSGRIEAFWHFHISDRLPFRLLLAFWWRLDWYS